MQSLLISGFAATTLKQKEVFLGSKTKAWICGIQMKAGLAQKLYDKSELDQSRQST